MSEAEPVEQQDGSKKIEDALQSAQERLNDILRTMEEQNNTVRKLEQEKYELIQSLIRSQDLNIQMREKMHEMQKELDHIKSPPKIIGEVVETLETGEIVIKNGTGQSFIVGVSQEIDAKVLQNGQRVSLDRNNLTILGKYPSSKDPIICAAEIIEKPTATYADIGGLDEQLRDVREAVELPLKNRDLFRKVGITPPKGVLLSGPPGTGKTLIAKAVANATNATYIRMVGSELVQKFIGEGGRLVRELFQLAREKKPCIIFIDEIDAIGAKRLGMDTTGDREVQRTLMQLLAEMDGFNALENVSIIAATNRIDIIDEALLRPGRFDRIIKVEPPNKEGILSILKIHARKLNMDRKVDLKKIGHKMDKATGAEIAQLCTEAGMSAIRDGRESITSADFDCALVKLRKKEDLIAAKCMFA